MFSKKVLIAGSLSLATACFFVAVALLFWPSPEEVHEENLARPPISTPPSPEAEEASAVAAESIVSGEAPESEATLASTRVEVGEGTLTLRGRVRDDQDVALAGVEVLLLETDGELTKFLARPISDRGRGRGRENVLGRLKKAIDRILARRPGLETSEDGSFEFAGLAPGAYQVAAISATHLSRLSPTGTLDETRPEVDLTIVLGSGSSLDGVVLSPGLELVADVRIGVQWHADDMDLFALRERVGDELLGFYLGSQGRETTSARDGTFRLTGLLPGKYDLAAEVSGYARTLVRELVADGPEVQIVLDPELVLRGRVVDLDDRPLENAEIVLKQVSRDSSDMRAVFRSRFRSPAVFAEQTLFETQADADGYFEIRNLAHGTYSAEVSLDGYQKVVQPYLALDLEAAEEDRYHLFELDVGHSISGLVVSAGGTPIARAQVRARFVRESVEEASGRAETGEEQRAGPDGRQRRRGRGRGRGQGGGRGRYVSGMFERMNRWQRIDTETDETGQFTFTTLSAGVYEVVVRSGDHLPHVEKEVATDERTLKIALERGYQIVGRVVDAKTDEPIVGARIRSESGRNEEELDGRARFRRRGGRDTNGRSTRSDEDGAFRVQSLAASLQTLAVDAMGYIRDEIPDVMPGGGELEVRLEPSGSISGRIRSASGEPVEGLQVLLRQEEDEDEQRGRRGPPGRRGSRWIGSAVETDADGAYEVPIDRAAQLRVVARGLSYITTESDVVEVENPRKRHRGVNLLMKEAARVTGIIQGADGSPLYGARIDVWPAAESDEDDSPRNRARRIFRRARTPGRGGSDSSDLAGEFEVGGLAEGSFEFRVRGPGHVDHQSEPFTLGRAEKKELVITLIAEETISGGVFSSDGSPLASAEITSTPIDGGEQGFLFGNRSLSDPLGIYRVGKLLPGAYNLRVMAAGHSSAYLENVPAGTQELDVTLDPLVTLEGVVVGTPSGTPASPFRMRLVPENDELFSRRERQQLRGWQNFENADGSFRIEKIPAGRYTLMINAPDLLPVADQVLDLPRGRALEYRTFSVPEGGVLAGVVLDENSLPVMDARVRVLAGATDETTGTMSYSAYQSSVSSAEGTGRGGARRRGRSRPGSESEENSPTNPFRQREQVMSAEDGSFLVRGLPDGLYKIQVNHDEYVGQLSEEREIIVDELGNYSLSEFRILMDSGAILRGQVLSSGAQTNAGVVVMLRGPAEQKTSQTDGQGRFEIRGLGLGSYEVRVRGSRSTGEGGRRQRSAGGSPPSFVSVEIGEKDRITEVEISLD